MWRISRTAYLRTVTVAFSIAVLSITHTHAVSRTSPEYWGTPAGQLEAIFGGLDTINLDKGAFGEVKLVGSFNEIQDIKNSVARQFRLPDRVAFRAPHHIPSLPMGATLPPGFGPFGVPRMNVIDILQGDYMNYRKMKYLGGPSIHGAGVDLSNGRAGLIMDFIDGKSLNDIIGNPSIHELMAFDWVGEQALLKNWLPLDMHGGNLLRTPSGIIRPVDIVLVRAETFNKLDEATGGLYRKMAINTVEFRYKMVSALKDGGLSGKRLRKTPGYINAIGRVLR